MTAYELEYTPETKTTLEAMRLTGRTVFHGPKVVLLWLQTLVAVFFVPAGFLASVMVVKALITGNWMFPNPFWVPAMFILGGGAAMLLSHRIYWVMAEAARTSRFGKRVRITINANAFTFSGGTSERRMDWGDIDAIVLGRRAIVVCTGNVGLPVPISAFEAPEVAQKAFEQMTQWHQEAIA